jgi:hypothetical protein
MSTPGQNRTGHKRRVYDVRRNMESQSPHAFKKPQQISQTS